LKGPDDTPYAKGLFEIDITIPADYPFSPPKMKFLTKGKKNKDTLSTSYKYPEPFV
jgi:ubiquitin-protein ligase